jgi:hypothetical protein
VQSDGARAIALLVVTLVLLGRSAGGQTFQFLPEGDAYYRIKPDIRFDFQAKQTMEAGDLTQAEIGPSLDFFLKPLVRLKNVTAFDLDEAKSRPLQLSIGFRYVPSSGKPTTWRTVLVATPRLPLAAGILLTDRNRTDLDWSRGQFTWRYRNRVKLERAIGIGSYHPIPYVSAEAFYQSQYGKLSTTALYAGCLLPVHKHFELDPYYEHENITGKRPNQQLNRFGIVLNFYF